MNNFLEKYILEKYNFLKKIKFRSPRERYFVYATVGFVVIFLFIIFVIAPLVARQRSISEEIPEKIKQLEKYRRIIAGRTQAEKDLKQARELYKTSCNKLLSGNTPPLAAANLQDILKTLAVKNLINIKSEKVLDIKGLDFFTEIPVQIEFVSIMTNLTNFCYDIENYEKTLIITDLNIQAASYRDPKDVRVALVIAGFIGGSKK